MFSYRKVKKLVLSGIETKTKNTYYMSKKYINGTKEAEQQKLKNNTLGFITHTTV